MEELKKKNYFSKLLTGDVSLNITFWIWFVFISFLINSFLNFGFSDYEQAQRSTNDTYIALSIYFLTLVYTIYIFISVIRSANKYKGLSIWKHSAKILVSLNLFVSLYSTIDIIKIFLLEDYAIANQISSYKQNLPLDIDSHTQLYNIDKEDKNIIYTYKLKYLDIKKTSNFNEKNFSERIQASICEDEGTLELLKKDYILKYTYLDKNNNIITKVTTPKEACGKSIYDLDILREILEKEKLLSYNL